METNYGLRERKLKIIETHENEEQIQEKSVRGMLTNLNAHNPEEFEVSEEALDADVDGLYWERRYAEFKKIIAKHRYPGERDVVFDNYMRTLFLNAKFRDDPPRNGKYIKRKSKKSFCTQKTSDIQKINSKSLAINSKKSGNVVENAEDSWEDISDYDDYSDFESWNTQNVSVAFNTNDKITFDREKTSWFATLVDSLRSFLHFQKSKLLSVSQADKNLKRDVTNPYEELKLGHTVIGIAGGKSPQYN